MTGEPRWTESVTQASGGIDPAADLAAIEHSLGDDDAFWARAGENLLAGNVRLIFISDTIPDGLQVIVEFLNEWMTPTEVLAIEVRQFLAGGDQICRPTPARSRFRRLSDVASCAKSGALPRATWLQCEPANIVGMASRCAARACL